MEVFAALALGADDGAAFAYVVGRVDVANAVWVHGLKVVAVAVVAQAVWGMSRQFCTDRARAAIAVLATLAMLALPTAIGQIAVIAACSAASPRSTWGCSPITPTA